MKLLLLIGDAAVGKMTIGQELMKITDLRLFHNHMTIELVIEIFGKKDNRFITKLRELIGEEFAKSDLYGMIYTFVWAFNQQEFWNDILHFCDIFKRENAEIYSVELVASQEARLQRNMTENRLKNKPSKRDVERSNRRILEGYSDWRFVSNDGEVPFDNYIKIDNSNLPPDVVAKMIKEKFSL